MLELILTSALASISTVVAYTRIEAGKDRRARARREEERERSSRRAKRLVELELQAVERILEEVAKRGRWPSLATRLPTAAWSAAVDQLAENLGPADWWRLSGTYEDIAVLNRGLDERLGALAGAEAENPARAVTAAFVEASVLRAEARHEIKRLWRAVREASWMLRAILGEGEDMMCAIASDEARERELWPAATAARA